MKKVTTVLTAIAFFFATSAFAKTSDPETVTPVVKAVFTKDFAKAENITWRKSADTYFAQFTIDSKSVTAAYNEKGELTGTSRYITVAELPMPVSIAIAKAYAGYTISDNISEISSNGEITYYFTASNDKYTFNVKADSNAHFTNEGRVKK